MSRLHYSGKYIMRIKKNLSILFSLLVALPATAQDNAYWSYTLPKGQTLWQFADIYLVSPTYVPKIQTINNITNPYKVPANKAIKVPYEWIRHQQADAVINAFSGSVQLISPQKTELSPAVGKKVKAGTNIKTGKNSQLILAFPDGSSLTLSSLTQIVLSRINYLPTVGATDVNVSVQSGGVSSSVSKPRLMNNRYQLQTPSAITAVRGTELLVNVDQKDNTQTSVLTGKVEVSQNSSNQDKQGQLVSGGFGIVTSADGRQDAPEELLDPPKDIQVNDISYNTPYIVWNPVERAAGYHVYFYMKRKGEFQLIRENIRSESSYFPQNLQNGDFKLSLRSQSSTALEGREFTKTFKITSNPLPPLVLAPQNGKSVGYGEKVVFSFSESSAAVFPLVLQVAEDKDFTKIIDTLKFSPTKKGYSYTPPKNKSQLYWRVARVGADKQLGRYSLSRLINLNAGGGTHIGLDEGAIYTVSAEPLVLSEADYKLILANDAEFKNIVYQKQSSNPEWIIGGSSIRRNHNYWAKIEVKGQNGYVSTTEVEKIYWP